MPNLPNRPWYLISSKVAYDLFQRAIKVAAGLIARYQTEGDPSQRELLNDAINLIRVYSSLVENEQIGSTLESPITSFNEAPSPIDMHMDENANLIGLATISEIYKSFKSEDK